MRMAYKTNADELGSKFQTNADDVCNKCGRPIKQMRMTYETNADDLRNISACAKLQKKLKGFPTLNCELKKIESERITKGG
jgi:hypothetical protein